jgi:hypothetical protein
VHDPKTLFAIFHAFTSLSFVKNVKKRQKSTHPNTQSPVTIENTIVDAEIKIYYFLLFLLLHNFNCISVKGIVS